MIAMGREQRAKREEENGNGRWENGKRPDSYRGMIFKCWLSWTCIEKENWN